MRDELSRRTLLIAIGVCAALLVAVPATAMYFLHHHQSLTVSADVADAEFAKLRARFAGQRPLLDMTERETIAVQGAGGGAIHSFHTVIFDTRRGPRLVHLTAPSAFARLFAH